MVKGARSYQHINVASQMVDKDSLFHSISRMVNIRKQHHTFGRGSMEWVETDNPAFAVYTRKYQGETLLIINNLSDSAQTISLPAEYHANYVDLISNNTQHIDSTLTFQPYAYRWLKLTH
jgi:maltose alpha-D-glucosyltransferase/alpha-amylase